MRRPPLPIAWARDVPVKGAHLKGCLFALASYANKQAECWPSQKTLALAAGVAERAIRESVK